MASRLLCLLLVAALTPAARAQAPVFPAPFVPQPVAVPDRLVPQDLGPDHAPSCSPIFLNETFSTGFFSAPGAGVELADDLHTTAGGIEALCAFDLGYFRPGAGTADAVVVLYDNDGADGAPGAVLAGPFLLEGLPSGTHAFHVEVAGGLVDEDVWMGVAFSDAVTGLLTFGPPTQGSSHDIAWLTPPGQSGNFGGQPSADFFLGLYSSPYTPATRGTWGGVKAIYR